MTSLHLYHNNHGNMIENPDIGWSKTDLTAFYHVLYHVSCFCLDMIQVPPRLLCVIRFYKMASVLRTCCEFRGFFVFDSLRDEPFIRGK